MRPRPKTQATGSGNQTYRSAVRWDPFASFRSMGGKTPGTHALVQATGGAAWSVGGEFWSISAIGRPYIGGVYIAGSIWATPRNHPK